MIHNYSHWPGGKGNEVALRVKYSEQYFKKLALDLYKGFLTDDEIQSVVEGKDYWIDSDEVIRRLNIRNAGDVCDVNSVAEDAVNQIIQKACSNVESEPPLPKKATKKR
jgi:hypothetical protein